MNRMKIFFLHFRFDDDMDNGGDDDFEEPDENLVYCNV